MPQLLRQGWPLGKDVGERKCLRFCMLPSALLPEWVGTRSPRQLGRSPDWSRAGQSSQSRNHLEVWLKGIVDAHGWLALRKGL